MKKGDETRTLTILRDRVLAVPSITLRFSPARGATFDVPLGLRPLVIGREPSCDVPLEDHGISQRHCEVSLTMRGIEIQDLHSKNGIFVHSLRILHGILPIDVPVMLGHSKFIALHAGAPSEIPLSAQHRLGPALGQSVIMRALFFRMEQAAATATHVVFWGEPGTGKRTLARALHDMTPGRMGAFVTLDASAEDAGKLETVLNESLEQAARGTLYVHEPGELPRELQTRLARTIHSRRDETRLVLGMREDPSLAVKRRALAPDFFAPNLPFVNLPVFPLRQRKDDIPLLVEFFLAQQDGLQSKDLPQGTMDLLEGHSWPGNVAQLEDVVVDIAQRAQVGERLLKSLVKANEGGAAEFSNASLKDAREEVVNAFEKAFVASMLRRHKGNVTHTAKAMGISRQMLHRMMVQHGIQNVK